MIRSTTTSMRSHTIAAIALMALGVLIAGAVLVGASIRCPAVTADASDRVLWFCGDAHPDQTIPGYVWCASCSMPFIVIGLVWLIAVRAASSHAGNSGRAP